MLRPKLFPTTDLKVQHLNIWKHINHPWQPRSIAKESTTSASPTPVHTQRNSSTPSSRLQILRIETGSAYCRSAMNTTTSQDPGFKSSISNIARPTKSSWGHKAPKILLLSIPTHTARKHVLFPPRKGGCGRIQVPEATRTANSPLRMQSSASGSSIQCGSAAAGRWNGSDEGQSPGTKKRETRQSDIDGNLRHRRAGRGHEHGHGQDGKGREVSRLVMTPSPGGWRYPWCPHSIVPGRCSPSAPGPFELWGCSQYSALHTHTHLLTHGQLLF